MHDLHMTNSASAPVPQLHTAIKQHIKLWQTHTTTVLHTLDMTHQSGTSLSNQCPNSMLVGQTHDVPLAKTRK